MKAFNPRTFLIWISSVLGIILVTIYIVLALYYRDGFSYGTYINGILATGRSVSELNESMANSHSLMEFDIETSEGFYETLSLDKNIFFSDYTDSLNEIKDKQNPFLWFINFIFKRNYDAKPVVIYDEVALSKEIDSLEIFRKEQVIPEVSLYKSEDNGYVLINSTQGVFRVEEAKKLIFDSVINCETDISLLPCYTDEPLTNEWAETIDIYEKISAFQDFHMNYIFGNDIEKLTPSDVCEWIKVDARGDFAKDSAGNLILDEEKVGDYINELALKYDTYDTVRHFTTHDGIDVTIPMSLFGNKIDKEAEREYLLYAYKSKIEDDRVPVYLHEEEYKGLDDIGPDYIEVNITKQHLYLIQNNEVVLDTDVVTGNTRGHNTPQLAAKLYNQKKNAILRGPGYESFVYYWCGVYKGIGIHDATWRNKFGGEIYKGNGSHGCVNVPVDVMKELYSMIDVGIPVLIFAEDTEENNE